MLLGSSPPSSPASGAGASAPASGPSITSCTCCAEVTISELAFTGNNVVENDTTGDFRSPEWQEGRAQSDQSPVSYARNRRISFSAKFRVTTAACLASESIAIRGRASFGSAALEWSGSFNLAPADTQATVSLTSDNSLVDEVGIFESTDISWEMNPCNMGWRSAGTTRNVVYVTLGDPSDSPNYWTLLDISCRAAAGTNDEESFVLASFAPFRSAIGDGNGLRRKRDDVELTYYKFAANTATSGVFSCSDLLSRADGTGRCGAWATFLVSMHQIHGITTSSGFAVFPISASGIIVKNCTFEGAGSKTPPFTHVGNIECIKTNGIPGQGKNNPQFLFDGHALVEYRNKIYDPSYGVGPISDLRTWESVGIEGTCMDDFQWIVFDGEDHIISEECSQGFIEYTAAAGDTLSSIATNFGTSAAALIDHRYNADFRRTHRMPYTISAGEKIIIPRDISNVAILERR